MQKAFYIGIGLFLLGGLAFMGTYEPSEPQGAPSEVVSERPISVNGKSYSKAEQAIKENPSKRAEVKYQVAQNLKINGKYNRTNGIQIEIIETRPITSPNGTAGVTIYARAWKNGEQIGFGEKGEVDIERFNILNFPVLVPDNNGDIVRDIIDPATREKIGERKLREDTQEAMLQVLEHNFRVMKNIHGSENIVEGKRGNTTLTAFPNAGTGTAPVDARMRRVSAEESFSTIRNGAGTSANNTLTVHQALLQSNADTTDTYDNLVRGGMGFDTSSIGTDAIDSAILSLHDANDSEGSEGLGDVNLEITAFNPADGSDIAASDYSNFEDTRLSDTNLAASTINEANKYHDWTLNTSGENHIEKNGNTYFMWRTAWDVDNSFDGTWASNSVSGARVFSADESGTTSDPKLVIEHSVAAVVEPPEGKVITF